MSSEPSSSNVTSLPRWILTAESPTENVIFGDVGVRQPMIEKRPGEAAESSMTKSLLSSSTPSISQTRLISGG